MTARTKAWTIVCLPMSTYRLNPIVRFRASESGQRLEETVAGRRGRGIQPEAGSRAAGASRTRSSAIQTDRATQDGAGVDEKKLPASSEVKRTMIETDHPELSVRRQCELMGLSRATYYRPPGGETSLNLRLMRLIDEEDTRAPF